MDCSNWTRAISYLSMEMFHIRCISHVLNLAVKKCMKSVDGSIKNTRAVLNSLRASHEWKEEFAVVCKEFQIEITLPTVACETRWSSNLNMAAN